MREQGQLESLPVIIDTEKVFDDGLDILGRGRREALGPLAGAALGLQKLVVVGIECLDGRPVEFGGQFVPADIDETFDDEEVFQRPYTPVPRLRIIVAEHDLVARVGLRHRGQRDFAPPIEKSRIEKTFEQGLLAVWWRDAFAQRPEGMAPEVGLMLPFHDIVVEVCRFVLVPQVAVDRAGDLFGQSPVGRAFLRPSGTAADVGQNVAAHAKSHIQVHLSHGLRRGFANIILIGKAKGFLKVSRK